MCNLVQMEESRSKGSVLVVVVVMVRLLMCMLDFVSEFRTVLKEESFKID